LAAGWRDTEEKGEGGGEGTRGKNLLHLPRSRANISHQVALPTSESDRQSTWRSCSVRVDVFVFLLLKI